jgi:hypothetical protein
MGVVDAQIDVYENEDTIFVATSYTNEDFIEFQYDLGGETPQIDFEELKIIDKE